MNEVKILKKNENRFNERKINNIWWSIGMPVWSTTEFKTPQSLKQILKNIYYWLKCV